MSCFVKNRQDSTVLTIPDTEEFEGVIYYNIQIQIGEVIWTVKHRYKDFVELHDKLVSDHGIAKDDLPPKKVIRNKCPLFIEKRREGLECYLKHALGYLQLTMPREFALFLDLHEYDILFLLQSMALLFFQEGDGLLQESKSYTFTPLQLHAISERLKQPCPPLELSKRQYDLSHVLDFCSQLERLRIQGAPRGVCVGTSNINPNELPFELGSFKNVKYLEVLGLPIENITDMGTLRETVVMFSVHKTPATHLKEILLCDVLHKDNNTEQQRWLSLTEADFSCNNITTIDDSVCLLPNIQILTLNQNRISEINNLSHLPKLSHLNMSENNFTICEDLHIKLGNILSIDLSQNALKSLKCFSKLYSLESLDASCNQITDINEIAHVGSLPCLEHLRLTGNPVACVVDYRVKVLEQFNLRAADIYLDNERPTEKECDTVRVLQALRIVKEGKTPTFTSLDTPIFPGIVNNS